VSRSSTCFNQRPLVDNESSSLHVGSRDFSDNTEENHDNVDSRSKRSENRFDKFHLRASITFAIPLVSIEVIDNDIDFENLSDAFVIRWVRYASTQPSFNPSLAQFVRSCGYIRTWHELRA